MSEIEAPSGDHDTRPASGPKNGENVWRFEQWPEEATRTPESPCFWVVETFDYSLGEMWRARRRYGAVNELARRLVAAGAADGPLEVVTRGTNRVSRWGSLYAAAKFTYREGEKPIYRAKYVPMDLGRLK